MTRITLTAKEREAVEWAFGAMHDYWGDACKAGNVPDADAEGVVENELTIPEGATLPYLDGLELVLSTWNEVNDDLLYRVGEQLPDMAESAKVCDGDFTPQMAAAQIGVCRRLATKIRNAMETVE